MAKKSIKQQIKDMKITIEGGHKNVKMDDIHHHNSMVNTGTGVHKSKKGKGSYTRKDKHKKSFY